VLTPSLKGLVVQTHLINSLGGLITSNNGNSSKPDGAQWATWQLEWSLMVLTVCSTTHHQNT
jgi:hypothetical protein